MKRIFENLISINIISKQIPFSAAKSFLIANFLKLANGQLSIVEILSGKSRFDNVG